MSFPSSPAAMRRGTELLLLLGRRRRVLSSTAAAFSSSSPVFSSTTTTPSSAAAAVADYPSSASSAGGGGGGGSSLSVPRRQNHSHQSSRAHRAAHSFATYSMVANDVGSGVVPARLLLGEQSQRRRLSVSDAAAVAPSEAQEKAVEHHQQHHHQLLLDDMVQIEGQRVLRRPGLVIFDKDGTLICFQSMWVPWALKTAKKLEEATRRPISGQVYALLGYDPVENKVRTGLLAQATMAQIRARIVELLVKNRVDVVDAELIVAKSVLDCDAQTPDALQQLDNLRELFGTLRAQGIKVAICTADSRAGTLGMLRALDLEDAVDWVQCGDDTNARAKPHPESVWAICDALGVPPQLAYVIGDTPADLGMGRTARVGATLGVLSGVGRASELEDFADRLIPSIAQLLAFMDEED